MAQEWGVGIQVLINFQEDFQPEMLTVKKEAENNDTNMFQLEIQEANIPVPLHVACADGVRVHMHAGQISF